MRFLNLLAYVGFLFGVTTSYAQEETSSLKFRYQYKSGEGIPDKVFALYKGSDSISSAITNENGEFELELTLEFSTEYGLLEQNSEWASKPITFETTYQPYDYVLECTTTNAHPDHFQGQIAYYLPNDTKNLEEFEVEQIIGLIKKYPEICIEFSQTITRSESEKTAKKRKATFLKFLEENGVDMSCIQFAEETRILKAFDPDQRSRIQGAIASLESKCN